MGVHICNIHKVNMKPEPLYFNEKDRGEYYCQDCFNLEMAIETIIKNNFIAVKKAKIDAVIKYIQNNCSGFIAEDLLQLLEHLKKG